MIKIVRSFATLNKRTDLVYKRLFKLNQEFRKLQDEAIQGVLNEQKRSRINSLEPQIHIYEKMFDCFTNIQTCEELIGSGVNQTEQSELLEEIKDSTNNLEIFSEEAVTLLVEKDEYDDINQVTVEFRPGVGGSEGSLFAEDLLNMIQNYCHIRGWDNRVLSLQKDQAIGKGCKLGVLSVQGDGVYQRLKCESGVHKVIRVPETESKGRLHSSTASIVVLPKVDERFQMNDKDIKIEFMKASGPGGQHVNKTESACRVTHVPTGIQVQNMEDRSQERNKQRALQILQDKLFAIHIAEKQEQLVSRRKSQVQGSDRSDKIRTYNFPQERITDHRTGKTLFGIEKMLQGELLDDFIDLYLQKIHSTKLEDLMDDLQNEV